MVPAAPAARAVARSLSGCATAYPPAGAMSTGKGDLLPEDSGGQVTIPDIHQEARSQCYSIECGPVSPEGDLVEGARRDEIPCMWRQHLFSAGFEVKQVYRVQTHVHPPVASTTESLSRWPSPGFAPKVLSRRRSAYPPTRPGGIFVSGVSPDPGRKPPVSGTFPWFLCKARRRGIDSATVPAMA